MYLLHALNIGLPILTLPFLTRSLGTETFGAYGLLLSLVAIGVIVIEYGYGVSGTRLLAQGDQGNAESVLGRVLAWQLGHLLVWLPLLFLMLIILVMIGKPISLLAMVLTAAITALAALTPLWYYVAKARVSQLVTPTLLSKLALMVLVMGVLPLLPSLELALFAYLVSWAWILPTLLRARKDAAQVWRAERWSDRLRAWRVFAAIPLQRIGSTLYTQWPMLFVATWFGLAPAGWYFLADRVVVGVIGLFVPLTAHLLPQQLVSVNPNTDDATRRRLRLMLAGVLLLSLLAAVGLMLLATWLCRLLGGAQFDAAGSLLIWLAPMVFLSTANALLMNTLYARNGEGVIARLIWLVGGLYLAVLFLIGVESVHWFAACRTAVELLTLLGLAAAVWQSQRQTVASPAPR